MIETLDLFRETRDSIQQGTTGGGRGDLSLAAWDRALQREMKAEGNLHPALCTPDGHYRVLRAVSEGLTALLLDRADSRVAMIRAVARELLATAVLRNLMFYFTPYTLNKVCTGIWPNCAPSCSTLHFVQPLKTECNNIATQTQGHPI